MPKFLSIQCLIKAIHYDDQSDNWNSFVAGITRIPRSQDPLATLPLREKRQNTPYTFAGMTPIRESIPETTDWGTGDWPFVFPFGFQSVGAIVEPTKLQPAIRQLVANPKTNERDIKPLVHSDPMYLPQEKKGFSKPQSTSFVASKWQALPEPCGNSYWFPAVGVILPATPDHMLLNRIFASDIGSHSRLHEKEGYSAPKERTSLGELEKGSDRYSEILARLRWNPRRPPLSVNPLARWNPTRPPVSDNPLTPAIFICRSHSQEAFTKAVMRGVIRAYDLNLCLLRKGLTDAARVKVVIYQPGFEHYQEISPDIKPIQIIQALTGTPVFSDEILQDTKRHAEFQTLIQILNLQHALLRFKTTRSLPLPQDLIFLKQLPLSHLSLEKLPLWDRNRFVLYAETMRALTELPQIQNLCKMNPYYANLIERLKNNDKGFAVYGFSTQQMRFRKPWDLPAEIPDRPDLKYLWDPSYLPPMEIL